MNNDHTLNEKWIKSSILGTIWAASEIVLGSFLHNLKVPFSGDVLTAIAIIILISISFVWTEKGLFWRAGLICALMKTMSPSAVIFGPMIAIFSEALLLEIFVRLFRRSYAGYLLGAVFAMFWNLFQKIANLIIIYGYDIVHVYTTLIEFLQKQLAIKFDFAWMPILIFLVIQIIFGAVSAIIGIKIGCKLLTQPASNEFKSASTEYLEKKSPSKSDFSYSLPWLAIDIILLIGALVLLNFSSWMIWSISTIVIVSIWIVRYKRAFRQLLKPKFWIFFVLLTMITALVFTKIQSASNGLESGLLIGLQMNFRAAIIIVGFSALGTELYSPKIRAFFLKTSFKQLPQALELSFESLPSIIATIPDFKSIIKNPVSIFYQIVSQAEYRLAEMKNKLNSDQKIFILTGSLDQGKTTELKKIVAFLKGKDISVGGIYSPKVLKNNAVVGYDIIDINTNEREVFLRQYGNDEFPKVGRFYIYPIGLHKGKNALQPSNNANNRIVVIDEVGRLELGNDGWSSCIQDLVDSQKNHILMVVRDAFVEEISKKWNIKQTKVYSISEMDSAAIGSSILEHFDNNNFSV